MEFNMNISI